MAMQVSSLHKRSIRDGAGMRQHVHSGNHAAESFISFIPLLGGLDEYPDLRYRLLKYIRRDALNSLCPPTLPIEALDLVRQDDSLDLQAGRKRDLEWVALPLRCDRTQKRQTDSAVVRCWRDDQGRPLTRLLMTSLGIEL